MTRKYRFGVRSCGEDEGDHYTLDVPEGTDPNEYFFERFGERAAVCFRVDEPSDSPRKADIPQEKYRADAALSRSDLFWLHKSPLHFKWAAEHPASETAAMFFGTAFHTLVLEPERFADEYIVHGRIDKRTKEGKALAAEIEASGRRAIDEETMQALEGMRDSVMSNPYAARLLAGEKEQSYFWTDPPTGIELKCRPDCRTDLSDTGVIVDLKTTDNADAEGFGRSCLNYGYDLQAAMYKQGVEAVEGKPHRFVFIAVEKKPPYACSVLEADELMIRKGSDDLRKYLETVSDCRRTGNWYGYNGSDGKPGFAELPPWLAKKYEEDLS